VGVGPEPLVNDGEERTPVQGKLFHTRQVPHFGFQLGFTLTIFLQQKSKILTYESGSLI